MEASYDYAFRHLNRSLMRMTDVVEELFERDACVADEDIVTITAEILDTYTMLLGELVPSKDKLFSAAEFESSIEANASVETSELNTQ